MERLRQLGRLHYDLRIEVSNTPGSARALSIQCPTARSSLSRPYSTSLATSQQEMMLTPKTRSTPRSSALAVFNSACLKLCNAKSLERVSRVAEHLPRRSRRPFHGIISLRCFNRKTCSACFNNLSANCSFVVFLSFPAMQRWIVKYFLQARSL